MQMKENINIIYIETYIDYYCTYVSTWGVLIIFITSTRAYTRMYIVTYVH